MAILSELQPDGEQLEQGLWRQFAQQKDDETRSKLIQAYTPLVRRISAKMYSRRVDELVEFDDYFQFGVIGLMEALSRYKPDSNATFKTYASYRISGAILNGIEKTSEYRTQNAYRKKLMKERIKSVESISNQDTFADMMNTAIYLALGYMLDESGRDLSKENVVQGHHYNSNELARLQQQLKYFVDKLPYKESLIIKYHYYESVSFEEIAQILDITKGRVSQLHKQALQRVRKISESESKLNALY